MTRSKKKSKQYSSGRKKTPRKASEFAYLNQRRCLRMMRRLYKDRFEHCGIFQNYKQQIRTCTKEELDQMISEFIRIEFPYMMNYQEYCAQFNFGETLKTLLLSDRCHKNEPITEGLDFEPVRKVLYEFNTRNLIFFFSTKSYALLYYHFVEFHGVQEIRQQQGADFDALVKEMGELYKEAEKYVKISIDQYWSNSRDQESQISQELEEHSDLHDYS